MTHMLTSLIQVLCQHHILFWCLNRYCINLQEISLKIQNFYEGSIPSHNCMFKVNNRNTRTMYMFLLLTLSRYMPAGKAWIFFRIWFYFVQCCLQKCYFRLFLTDVILLRPAKIPSIHSRVLFARQIFLAWVAAD